MIEPNQVLRQAKESTIVPSWEWEGRDEQAHVRTMRIVGALWAYRAAAGAVGGLGAHTEVVGSPHVVTGVDGVHVRGSCNCRDVEGHRPRGVQVRAEGTAVVLAGLLS